MTIQPNLSDYVACWTATPFGALALLPWQVTAQAEALVRTALGSLDPDYAIRDEIAVHRTATVEPGAILKGPAIIGPGCFIAATAYLRGGCYLAEKCIIGPAAELKTSFMAPGSKLAHLNFVGDSILGEGVNIEAGAMIANYRNEHEDKRIRIQGPNGLIDTGDGTRIGANAVVAPGALLPRDTRIERLHLVDQAPPA